MKKIYYFTLPISLVGVILIVIGFVNDDLDLLRYGFIWIGIGIVFIIYHKIKKK